MLKYDLYEYENGYEYLKGIFISYLGPTIELIKLKNNSQKIEEFIFCENCNRNYGSSKFDRGKFCRDCGKSLIEKKIHSNSSFKEVYNKIYNSVKNLKLLNDKYLIPFYFSEREVSDVDEINYLISDEKIGSFKSQFSKELEILNIHFEFNIAINFISYFEK